jgi:hypothetical protein
MMSRKWAERVREQVEAATPPRCDPADARRWRALYLELLDEEIIDHFDWLHRIVTDLPCLEPAQGYVELCRYNTWVGEISKVRDNTRDVCALEWLLPGFLQLGGTRLQSSVQFVFLDRRF